MSSEDIGGEIVSEEEAAHGLGFESVTEFRRWDTELGRKVSELEYALRQAKDEASRFQWHGRRMQIVLEKVRPALGLVDGQTDVKKLQLAIDVVLGRGVDWGNTLKDFFAEEID